MEYKFRGVFNRDNEYTIDCDIPLDLFDEFSLSIKKIDNDNKSFSYDNIDCVLKYGKKGLIGVNKYELDGTNFSGFYLMVEIFKNRKCLSMGEPIELIVETKAFEYEGVTLENADNELKLAFEKYATENGLMNLMFQCFLKGVSYGKSKTHL